MPPRSGIALMRRSGSGSVSYRVALGVGLAVLFAAAARADDKPACKPAAIGTGAGAGGHRRPDRCGSPTAARSGSRASKCPADDGEAARTRPSCAGDAGVGPRNHPDAARSGNRPLRPGRGAGGGAARHRGQSVQQALLAQGHARVSANIGDVACAAAFWARKRPPGQAGLGLWADPYYVMRNAEDPAGILAVRGRFAVVEGKVLSVRESGGTIYVNFGRRWSDDFTVTVLKRNERSFTAAGLPLKKLAGQHVRVRGLDRGARRPVDRGGAPGADRDRGARS